MAFVHDYLTQFGGAERVLLELRKLYPDGPVFTSIYDPAPFDGAFDGVDVRTTFLQRWYGITHDFRALLPLYPRAFDSLDLRGFDLVISSTTAFAKGVRTRTDAVHVCYIHTPTRFLWYPEEYADDVTPLLLRPALACVRPWLRHWDRAAAQRPNFLVSNSHNVQQRVASVYGRSSDVVHCPVLVEGFDRSPKVSDFFLVMTRLLPYKRVQLAIEACNELGARLVIAGSGPDEPRLRRLAGPTIEFAGFVDDARRKQLVSGARALIVCGEEDFGLVPLEAAAAGRPTVAFAAGGALETVVEGATGLFFREPQAQSLKQALQALDETRFDPQLLRAHAERFSPQAFRSKFEALIDRYVNASGRVAKAG
ncbi:MAG TPA: glycosyltransferase [Candidatus Acidoferrales bacterium]|nr:glycosyltransferase [Candidatus Acidoferrales bacterium]